MRQEKQRYRSFLGLILGLFMATSALSNGMEVFEGYLDELEESEPYAHVIELLSEYKIDLPKAVTPKRFYKKRDTYNMTLTLSVGYPNTQLTPEDGLPDADEYEMKLGELLADLTPALYVHEVKFDKRLYSLEVKITRKLSKKEQARFEKAKKSTRLKKRKKSGRGTQSEQEGY